MELIFGGTTEGRLLAEYCVQKKIPAAVSVATRYGAELLPVSPIIRILTGRLDENEIADIIRSEKHCRVIDATHPYAVEVGKNIKAACEKTGAEYIRIIRKSEPEIYGKYFNTPEEAAEYLRSVTGNIFIATGSKELPVFCADNFPERCTVRILPDEEMRDRCRKSGFKKIICGKGPFSYEENLKDFQGCAYVVTKESGSAGGFPEKYKAARELGAELVIIRRPIEKGITLEEAEKIISEELQ